MQRAPLRPTVTATTETACRSADATTDVHLRARHRYAARSLCGDAPSERSERTLNSGDAGTVSSRSMRRRSFRNAQLPQMPFAAAERFMRAQGHTPLIVRIVRMHPCTSHVCVQAIDPRCSTNSDARSVVTACACTDAAIARMRAAAARCYGTTVPWRRLGC